MNQTEIDELRRLHDAATPAPWNGTWNILTDDGDPIARTDVSLASDPAIADNDGPLIVAARNALPRLLAALEEARAERDEANGLVERMEHDNRVIARELDCSWGGSANPEHECKEDNPCLMRKHQDAEERLEATATFLERATTRRCYLAKQAAEAERDALKGAAHTAFVMGADWARYQLTQCTSFPSERDEASAEAEKRFPYVPRAYEVLNKELATERDALKAKLDQTRDWYADRWARLRAFLAKGSAMEKGACDIMANGHLLADQDRKSAVALATERAEAAEAKLAALVESCEMALDIDSEDISVGAFHDKWRGAPGYGNGDGSREILSKALAAAKVQP